MSPFLPSHLSLSSYKITLLLFLILMSPPTTTTTPTMTSVVKRHAPLTRLVLYLLLGLWSFFLFIFCVVRLAYTLTPRPKGSLMNGLPFYGAFNSCLGLFFIPYQPTANASQLFIIATTTTHPFLQMPRLSSCSYLLSLDLASPSSCKLSCSTLSPEGNY